jgi:predicted nucleotidyltransferase
MYGLSEQTISDLQSIFRKQKNIEKVLIFGSRAKGNYREGSDIDLAAIGDGISRHQLLDICNDIDDMGILYNIDIVDYEKQKGSPIGKHIDRVGKPFYVR